MDWLARAARKRLTDALQIIATKNWLVEFFMMDEWQRKIESRDFAWTVCHKHEAQGGQVQLALPGAFAMPLLRLELHAFTRKYEKLFANGYGKIVPGKKWRVECHVASR
eukprot:CAMPEP_0175919070 /NCGR_PEP_ID=MMETSP0108-20121206/12206_1 /TAXON_ID=195067 ORGANISM="Goniomonas pacifica, Strain CCMP1869" /NCGR_SAMPLE_ID=MMETSP0108 /ASSEMBLY_ACC=CAM_ASM_000204 /LENGTH=108 /DNA_ID=CAMNT_0017241709 /DNA_START=385 /DNA_END=707 /DNA_ORIENTATION=-